MIECAGWNWICLKVHIFDWVDCFGMDGIDFGTLCAPTGTLAFGKNLFTLAGGMADFFSKGIPEFTFCLTSFGFSFSINTPGVLPVFFEAALRLLEAGGKKLGQC
jgi:hypothetical protein